MNEVVFDGVTYRVGCLIEAIKSKQVTAYAHQANCVSQFGSGIAPVLARNFPDLHNTDALCEIWPEERLGSLTHTDLNKSPVGFNLYGQLFPGRNTDYKALASALRELNSILKGTDHVLGIPKIGCGIGGGDWSVVSNIIKKELTDVKFVVYILSESDLPCRGYTHASGIVF